MINQVFKLRSGISSSKNGVVVWFKCFSFDLKWISLKTSSYDIIWINIKPMYTLPLSIVDTNNKKVDAIVTSIPHVGISSITITNTIGCRAARLCSRRIAKGCREGDTQRNPTSGWGVIY